MDTETLIRALARDEGPTPRSQIAARIALALGVGLGFGLLALSATLGFRPDLGTAMWAVAAKALFAAVIGTAGLGAAMHLSRTLARTRAALPLLIMGGASLLIAAIALASEMPEHRWAAWTGNGFPWCVVLIPVFSIPTALGLVWALRDGAPTRLTLAGAAIGALSGSVGTIVYAGFCPVDSIAFVTTWYVAGIALSAAVGALAGRWLLRW
ncbi:MAG: DUF1109 domain-containing protein [Hyphomonadaceae bacterium]|jgi:hypothetical protein|nr:DUF1109 domain-containing protein [Hyphomonadaceae bacterium]